MNCEQATERILSLPTGKWVDGELTNHLAGCPACTVAIARIRKIDSLVAALPVPDSTPRKAAFLASIAARTSPRTASPSWQGITRNSTFRTIAALAFAVMITVSAIVLWPRDNAKIVAVATTKHDLLKHSVAFACEQGKQPSSASRMLTATNYAGQILSEVRGIYLATKPDDTEVLSALSELFEKTIRDGVMVAASHQPVLNPQEHRANLDHLMPALESYDLACRQLQLSAPAHVKPILASMLENVSKSISTLTAMGAARTTPLAIPTAAGIDAGLELQAMKANRAVIEVLASRGLKAGAVADAVDRADEVRAGASTIHAALARAVLEKDADRTVELGEHLADILVNGVKPAVDHASGEGTNPNSPSYERVMALKARAKEDAARARQALSNIGRLGDDARVIKTRQLLEEAAGVL